MQKISAWYLSICFFHYLNSRTGMQKSSLDEGKSSAEKASNYSQSYSDHKLKDCECKIYAVPDGGQWFGTQASLLAARRTLASGSGFLIGWDKDSKKGSKVYGLYQDASSFFRKLSENPPDKRYGYELISENTLCKLYADIEWEGPNDEKHTKIQWIVLKLREYLRNVFSEKRIHEIHVCCGSRQKDDGSYKNSYHIVCPSIVFYRNHDGKMKSLMEKLCSQSDDEPAESNEWFYYSGNGNKKCYIDLSVYSRNRLIRLPGCCKKGSSTPLVRISGSGKDEDDQMTSTYADIKDPEYWAPFLITQSNVEISLLGSDAIVVGTPDSTGNGYVVPAAATGNSKRNHESIENPDQAAKSGSKRARENPVLPGTPPLPLTPCQLQDALGQMGDSVSIVSKIQFKKDTQGVFWQVQCDQKKQARPCLANKNETHMSNNCLLFIRPSRVTKQQQQFTLEYHCTAETCKHTQSSVLGFFRLDLLTYTCEFSEVALRESDNQEIHCPNTDGTEGEPLSQGGEQGPSDTSDIKPNEGSEPCSHGESRTRNGHFQNDGPENTTYEIVKQRFEECCFKVRNPFLYVRLEYAGMDRSRAPEVCLLKHSELQSFFCHLHHYEKVLGDSSEHCHSTWQKKSFIPAWLKDPNKKEVSTIVVDPKGTTTDSFNLWTGYLAESLTLTLTVGGITFDNESAAAEYALGPIYQHIIQVVADGNESHAQWLLDWIANIVQRPWQKSQVAIMLYGKQGCGKGIIFDWLRKHVLGPHHTFQTADPENDLFGRFSQGLVNVSLVQVDEVKNLHEYADKIKDAITNRTVKMEKKNKDPVTVDAYANIIFTSNNENALKVPGDDRRTVLFRCSSMHKGNKQYFDNLARHLSSDGVACWFYKFLKQRDLSKYPYDFQSSRPITDYYRESQNASISLEKRYLSAFVNGDGPISITSDHMYQNFKLWADSENVRFTIKAHSAFGREMGRVNGIEIQKTKNSNRYKIDKSKVRNFLLDNREYDEEAVLHESCQQHLLHLRS